MGLALGWNCTTLPAKSRSKTSRKKSRNILRTKHKSPSSTSEKIHNSRNLGDRPVIASNLDYARKHQRVIARVKRFFHRNEVLGRESTAEEILFLQGPASQGRNILTQALQ
jgi:uncharacterized protein (DUF924 family)